LRSSHQVTWKRARFASACGEAASSIRVPDMRLRATNARRITKTLPNFADGTGELVDEVSLLSLKGVVFVAGGIKATAPEANLPVVVRSPEPGR